MKVKEDRVRETITILKKMIELGVSKSYPPFVELREKMSEWVKTGNGWSGKIRFPSYKRIAIIVLPGSAHNVASVEFNMMSS